MNKNGYLVAAFILILWPLGLCAQDELFENSASKISIPYNDFKQIVSRIKPDTIDSKPIPKLPAQLAVSDVQVTGKLISDRECLFTAVVKVEVIDGKSWLEVPVGRGLQIFPDVMVNTTPGSIGMKEDGTVFFLLKGAGLKTITYRFSVPVALSSGQMSLSFPLPGQAAGKMSLALDGAAYIVMVNGRSALLSKKENDRFIYEGGLGDCRDVTVSWEKSSMGTGGNDPLVTVFNNIMYGIGADYLHMRAQINCNVIHNGIRSLSILVPSNMDVVDFSGSAVASWDSRDSADKRLVSVYFKYDVKEKAVFTLNAEMKFDDSTRQLGLPPLTVLGAIRQEGTIGVGVTTNVELNPLGFSTNVVRRDKRELQSWFSDQGEVIHVFQYLSENYRIEMQLTFHENVPVLNAIVTGAQLKSMIRHDGKMITEANLQIRNRGEQFMRMSWSSDFQLWSVYCNGEPARPSLDTSTGELLVPLKRPQDDAAETSLRLVYLSKCRGFGSIGKQKIEYPTFNVAIENIKGTLYIPDNVRPFFEKGNIYLDRKEHFRSSGLVSHIFGLNAAWLRLYNHENGSDLGQYDQSTKQNNVSETEMKQLLPDLQSQSAGAFEAGILSIPVKLNFEGKALPLSSPMLKRGDVMNLSFWFHILPVRNKRALQILTFLLMIIAGVCITRCLWSGFSKAVIFWGVCLPFALAYVVQLILDRPLDIDTMLMVPILFVVWIAGKRMLAKIMELILTSKAERSRKMPLPQETEMVSVSGADTNE